MKEMSPHSDADRNVFSQYSQEKIPEIYAVDTLSYGREELYSQKTTQNTLIVKKDLNIELWRY
jgi:hypothetical protein